MSTGMYQFHWLLKNSVKNDLHDVNVKYHNSKDKKLETMSVEEWCASDITYIWHVRYEQR